MRSVQIPCRCAGQHHLGLNVRDIAHVSVCPPSMSSTLVTPDQGQLRGSMFPRFRGGRGRSFGIMLRSHLFQGRGPRLRDGAHVNVNVYRAKGTRDSFQLRYCSKLRAIEHPEVRRKTVSTCRRSIVVVVKTGCGVTSDADWSTRRIHASKSSASQRLSNNVGSSSM
jgi:hypothetical protein